MKNFITFFLVLNSLLLSQWTQIDMMPFEGRIIGFYMTDSMNITAAFDGDSCSIIKSSDGGRNWVISRQIPLAYLAWVEFLDEDHIFVGGQFPIICKRTSNGGATWSNVSIPSIYYQIRKLQFFDYNNGYALVEFSGGSSYLGRLLKTTDGGMSWVDIDMVRPNLSGFRFINKNTGWLFGDSLYRTTDGGSTFTLVPLPFNFKNPRSLDVIHDSIIVMGGLKYVESSPHIILTKPITAFSFNRGSTWRVKDFGTDDVWGDADNIRLLDENTAITTLSGSYNYAGGYTGVIYTTNQGLTWSKGAGEVTNYNFSDMKFLNNKVYVGGSEASFLASGNRLSDPWELRFEQEYQGPQGAAFLNPGYAVIGTASRSSKPSKVYISNDKGNSWIVKYAPWHYLYDMAISPDSVLYSLSNNSLYASNLACDTINTVTSFFTSVADLEILPNGDMWVCASRNLLFSSDHGQSWVTRFTLTSGDFYKIRMFADGTGYVIDGSIYKTTDHGNTWTKLGFNQYSILDFDFYDRNNGFVIGSYGKIHRTRDGGIYFEQLNLAGMTNTNAVFCLDSLNIFISGTKVYSTYDGGMIWKENLFEGIPAGPGNTAALHMFDHSNGIYVGQHAPIWRTYNRGNTPVELSSFSAVSLGNKVALQWTTETETNNMGFEIERRYKHSDWKTITFSKGSGTSTRKIYYGYDDYEPKAPCILYYRLKQIDYNGTFEYSKEVEVIFGEVPEDYAIQQNYPNPFNPSTKINFSLPEENKVVIRVFNPMGELVQEINRGTLSHGYFEQDIEMGSNPSGMYFCQALCTNTKTERTKSLTIKMVLMK